MNKKTIQKNTLVLGGLVFLLQISLVPMAQAAGLFDQGEIAYATAATSAEPVIYNHDREDNVIIRVTKTVEDTIALNKVIDEPEPTMEQVKEYVLNEAKKAGLNTREVAAIVNCESRWDYKVVSKPNYNGTKDMGLWQINSIHKNISDTDKLDFKAATKWAIAKRLDDGSWSAWSCARILAIR
ncbi:MAG: transglycosylase SLT domain-containing protein [Patescibacteria group bacterium]